MHYCRHMRPFIASRRHRLQPHNGVIHFLEYNGKAVHHEDRMHISQIFIPSLASTAEAFLKYAPKNLLTDSHERHQQQPNRVP